MPPTRRPTERQAFQLSITEESSRGLKVTLQHSGHFPNVLSGIPRDVLRKARPWVWTSYERKILREARSMTWPAYRLVRDTLVLERARIIMDRGPLNARFPKRNLFDRLRARWQHQEQVAARVMDPKVTKYVTGLVAKVVPQPEMPAPDDPLPPPVATPEAPRTLSEMMRQQSGTALAHPRSPDPRDRSR